MKKICIMLFLLCMFVLCGCSEVMDQVETAAQQIDMETIITEVIESIDWQELKADAAEGYDALVEQYPALKGEAIKAYLKNHGLELIRNYVESSDARMQENARKLGEIIKILYPELTDEVDTVISQ